jgi:hypothetical protein
MAINNQINLNAANPLSATTGGTGVSSPTANGVMIAQGASPVTSLVLTNGQLAIGSTGASPVAAAIIAGTNISVTNGTGTITIANTLSPAGTTTEVTGTSQTAVVNNNYIASSASVVTVTLPAAPASVGDFVKVIGKGSGGWSLVAGSGSQVIRLGNTASGAGGSASSTQNFDSVEARVITAGASAVWSIINAVGNINIV